MKLPFKTLWSEFKAFAFKGNMIDLAVAVVIGAAFGKVINALVDDVIMPSVSYVVTGAKAAANTATDIAQVASNKVGLTTLPATTQAADTQPSDTQPATQPVVVTFAPPAAPAPAPAPVPAAKPPEQAIDVPWRIGRIKIGDFIGALINFIIIAFAVFMVIVKLLGSVMKKVGGTPKPTEPTTRECPECLSLIPLKARRCAHCTAVLAPIVLPPTADETKNA